jgi:hypothetical protein
MIVACGGGGGNSEKRPERGEEGVLYTSSDSGSVIIGASEEGYRAWSSANSSNDKQGIMDLLRAGQVDVVPARTRVLVLEPGIRLTKVRILDGKQAGMIAVVPPEYIHYTDAERARQAEVKKAKSEEPRPEPEVKKAEPKAPLPEPEANKVEPKSDKVEAKKAEPKKPLIDPVEEERKRKESDAKLRLSAVKNLLLTGKPRVALQFAEELVRLHPGSPQAKEAEAIIEMLTDKK